MKKKLLFFCFSVLMIRLSSAQCTIQDGSFENWQFKNYSSVSGPITLNTPDGWKPLISQLLMYTSGTQAGILQQPTDAKEGSISLQLYADASGTYLNGGDVVGNFECNTDPTAIYAFHKFEGWSSGDTASIIVSAIDYSSGNPDTVGSGVLQLHAEVMNWTAFQVPINYTGSGADSLSIYIAFFPNAPTQPKRFKIDFFTLQSPMSILDQQATTTYNIYPNPADDYFIIEGLEGKTEIKIYDLSGRIIVEKNSYSERENIRIDHLNAGIYIIEFTGMQKKDRFILTIN